MSYNKINWRDYPDITTPVNATNLGIMDNQIKANADAIGDIDSISELGSTISGALNNVDGKFADIVHDKMFYFDNKSIAAGANVLLEGTKDISENGYYATIYATRVMNASSSGSNYANVYVNSAIQSDGKLKVMIKNTGTTAAKVQVRVYVLYFRNDTYGGYSQGGLA